MEVVLVVRVLAAVAIVVSVCCGTTALIERGRVPRCVYAALPAYTRPFLRIRGPSCVYAAHRAFTRPIVRKRRGVRECAPQVCIREKARLRERWVRICKRCVYAPGCVYAR